MESSARKINEENLKRFEEEISATDWNFINAYETADEKFNAFEITLSVEKIPVVL